MILRIARHTDNFDPLIAFYCDFLGLELTGSFEDHNGYDGIFIGKKDVDWHLEFTKSDLPAEHHFDPDDLLVFYPKSQAEYNHIVKRFKSAGVPPTEPMNPYWKNNGFIFLDPDGYGVVISNQKIN